MVDLALRTVLQLKDEQTPKMVAAVAQAEAALKRVELQDLKTAAAQQQLEQATLRTAAGYEALDRAALLTVKAQSDVEKADLQASIAQERLQQAHIKTSAAMEKQAATSSKKLEDALNGVGKAALITAAAVLGIGLVAAKMAGDFQQSMEQLVTSAGESQTNLKMVSDGVLKMAVDTGTSTQQLASGMYMVESASFHGANGLKVLQAAAEGAKAENADLGAVANAVTSGLNAYGLGADKAAMVTNTLIATVASGKMHMQDLASSLGAVLPAASKSGISLQEVGAAMATMTMQGTPAADAATYLRQMFVALDSPGSKAATTLKEIGLSASQISQDMRKQPDGLVNTLQEISVALAKKFPESAQLAQSEFAKVKAGQESMDDALANLSNNASPEYVGALKNISGGVKNMMAMLELTGPQLGTFKGNLDTITGAVKAGGDQITNWDKVQQNFNFKLDQAKQFVETLGIKLGTTLLPEIMDMANKLAPVLLQFANWLVQSGFLKQAFDLLNQVLQTALPWIEGLATAAEHVVSWFMAGGIQGAVLKDALIAVGIAIGLMKLKDFINDMMTIFTVTIPKMVGQLFFWQQANNSVATSEAAIGTTMRTQVAADVAAGAAESEAAIGGIGTKAVATQGVVDAAATGMKLSLAGVLGWIGLIIAAIPVVMQLNQAAHDNMQNIIHDQAVQMANAWQAAHPGQPLPPDLQKLLNGNMAAKPAENDTEAADRAAAAKAATQLPGLDPKTLALLKSLSSGGGGAGGSGVSGTATPTIDPKLKGVVGGNFISTTDLQNVVSDAYMSFTKINATRPRGVAALSDQVWQQDRSKLLSLAQEMNKGDASGALKYVAQLNSQLAGQYHALSAYIQAKDTRDADNERLAIANTQLMLKETQKMTSTFGKSVRNGGSSSGLSAAGVGPSSNSGTITIVNTTINVPGFTNNEVKQLADLVTARIDKALRAQGNYATMNSGGPI